MRPGQKIRKTPGPDFGVKVIEPGGAPGNGLLNCLIAYWPGDEVAGNLLDAHVNALHLNDMNTVTSNPGHVYPLARQYTWVNNEYHTRNSDPLLETGDLDFTVAAWVYLDSKPGIGSVAMAKQTNVAVREYNIQHFPAGVDRFRWLVFNAAGAIIGQILANTLGAPALMTWYLICAWHDSVANTVNIQANGGGVDSAATVGIPAVTPALLQIGNNNLGNFWDGRIGPTAFWKSAPGGCGVLTAAKRAALWNGGAGLPYASFTF